MKDKGCTEFASDCEIDNASSFQFVLDYAAQMEMKAVRLDVYEKNVPAISLYENMGFEYVGTVDLGYSKYGLEYFKLYQKELC